MLQNQEVQRVGALTARKVDVRVIAATNHDLRVAVKEKRFREDLYYRLSKVEIPPLADRKEDLLLLERHFIAKFAAQYSKEIHGLTRRAQIRLSRHSWPGNVRELEYVIGHAAMMTMADMIDIPDLPPYLQAAVAEIEGAPAPSAAAISLDDNERLLLMRALEEAKGNRSRAARILRIGRDALRYKLKKHNLDTPGRSRCSTAASP